MFRYRDKNLANEVKHIEERSADAFDRINYEIKSIIEDIKSIKKSLDDRFFIKCDKCNGSGKVDIGDKND